MPFNCTWVSGQYSDSKCVIDQLWPSMQVGLVLQSTNGTWYNIIIDFRGLCSMPRVISIYNISGEMY